MAQARHIGKIVLSLGPPTGRSRRRRPVPADGTYLITGGLGALGLATARWLVDRGARHLVLVGRRAPTPQARGRDRRLRARRARRRACAADVADCAAGRSACSPTIAQSCRRCAGVVHAAGVLDDGVLITSLTTARRGHVSAPKVAGAWNLHGPTRDRPLDFFVLFSSVAGACSARRARPTTPRPTPSWTRWPHIAGAGPAGAEHRLGYRGAEIGLAAPTRTAATRWPARGTRAITPIRRSRALDSC